MSLLQQVRQLFSKHSPVPPEVHENIASVLQDAKETSANLLATSETLKGLVDSLVVYQNRREAARQRLEEKKSKGWPT